MISPITDLTNQWDKLVERMADLSLKFNIPHYQLGYGIVYRWTDEKAEKLYNSCLETLKYVQRRIDRYYMDKQLIKDKCVVCGRETSYYKDERVENRECYVEGGGQLCPDCWNDIYNEKEVDDKLTLKKIGKMGGYCESQGSIGVY